jgi:hypothetical protein
MIDRDARSFSPMVRARIAHLWITHASVIVAQPLGCAQGNNGLVNTDMQV